MTKGLDGLSDRLKEYVSLGAKFCKWRAVITIGDPSAWTHNENIRQTQRLGLYAITCQENGLVPMVEPEVLLEGSHSIDQAREASRKNLTALFEELKTLVWL